VIIFISALVSEVCPRQWARRTSGELQILLPWVFSRPWKNSLALRRL